MLQHTLSTLAAVSRHGTEAARRCAPLQSACRQASTPSLTPSAPPLNPGSGQKRLTNVAVVRLKQHGFRFEVACYRNTVLSWRAGVCVPDTTVPTLRCSSCELTDHLLAPRSGCLREKNLDNVLQSTTVYANVSKVRHLQWESRATPSCTPSNRSLLSQGVLANKDDLQKVFGTKEEEAVCRLVRDAVPLLTAVFLRRAV